MFKPLLRTLPTLSGNIKIACNLTNISQVSHDVYEGYVRYAHLLPISSQLFQKNIEVNLLHSSYEYDVKRFFKYYSDSFYKSAFTFNTTDYILLDKYNEQKQRDLDFEFGCKRVSYLKNGSQFAFFAPIYIDSVDDIPDYFELEINFINNINQHKKKLRINIGNNKEYKSNYLYTYINKYISKINSNVIFCLPKTRQNTYYGIDCQFGGFTTVVDNVSSKIYATQMTINNFDAILSKGYERNKIVIRQIIPLSFYFNINDILTPEEINRYSNAKVKIKGEWYVHSKKSKLYDFNIDYTTFNQPVLKSNDTGILDYITSNNNIMDTKFPALNDGYYINYKYSNKISPYYNRWKLKYSSDSNPYIINMSWAFSNNQNSNFKYGEFPEDTVNVIGLVDLLKINNLYYYNLMFPINNKSEIYNNNTRYNNIYFESLNAYSTSWFNVIDNYDNIFNNRYWKTVEDDKCYYSGILYNLTNLYKYIQCNNKIDKFSVFLKFNIVPVDYNRNFLIANKILTYGVSTGISTNLFKLNKDFIKNQSTKNIYILNGDNLIDNIYTNRPIKYNGQTSQGQFINLLDYNIDEYERNVYYNTDELKANQLTSILFKYISIYTDKDNKVTRGYELLPIYQIENLYNYNKLLIPETDNDGNEIESNVWLLSNLYISSNSDSSLSDNKILIRSNAAKNYVTNKVNNLPNVYDTSIYVKHSFISKWEIYNILYKAFINIYNDKLSIFSKLNAADKVLLLKTKEDIYKFIYNKLNNITGKETEEQLTNIINNGINDIFEYYFNTDITKYYYTPILTARNSLGAVNYGYNCFIKNEKFVNVYYGDRILNTNCGNDTTDNDFIYADIYNLKPLLENKQITLGLTSTTINNYINKLTKYEMYAKIPNIAFLHLYIDKICGGINGTKTITDNHILETIFIKRRYLINNTETNTISFKDIYEPISKYFSIKNYNVYTILSEFSKHIVYNSTVTVGSSKNIETPTYCWGFTNYAKENFEIFKSNGWHTEDKLELYFKKEFIRVDETIMKLIGLNTDNYTDLYLYKILKPNEYNRHLDLLYKVYNSNNTIPEQIVNNSFKYEYRYIEQIYENTIDSTIAESIVNTTINKYNNINELNQIYTDYNDIDYITIKNGEEYVYEKNVTNEITLTLETIADYEEKLSLFEDTDENEEKTFYEDEKKKYEERLAELKNNKKLTLCKVNLNSWTEYTASIYNSLIPFYNSIYMQEKYYEKIYTHFNLNNILTVYEITTDNTLTGNKYYRYDCNPINTLYDVQNLSDTEPITINGIKYCTYNYMLKYGYNNKEYEENGVLKANDNYGSTVLYTYSLKYNNECTFECAYDYTIWNNPKHSYVLVNDTTIDYITAYYNNDTLTTFNINTQIDISNVTSGISLYNNRDLFTNVTSYVNGEYIGKICKVTKDGTEITKINPFTKESETKVAIPNIKNNQNITYIAGDEILYSYYDDLGLYKDYNISTYKWYNTDTTYTTYGFYVINQTIDNTLNNFNMQTDNYEEPKVICYINGISLYPTQETYDTEHNKLVDIYKYILPFTKNKVYDYFSNNIDTIIEPNKYEIKLNYKQSELVYKGEVYAYNIYLAKQDKKITLQRYFDSIVPLLTETDNIKNTYNLLYKTCEATLNTSYISNVTYNTNVNIYSMNPLTVYNNKTTYTKYVPVEYKHFNDSKYINLNPYFEIEVTEKLTYDKLLEYETYLTVFEYFKNYINNHNVSTYNNDEILFLYKKYKVEFDSVCMGLTALKNEKLYKLIYKFILL